MGKNALRRYWLSTSQQPLLKAHCGHALNNDACMKTRGGGEGEEKVTANQRVGLPSVRLYGFFLSNVFPPLTTSSFSLLLLTLLRHTHSLIHTFIRHSHATTATSLHLGLSTHTFFKWIQTPRAAQESSPFLPSLLSCPRKCQHHRKLGS